MNSISENGLYFIDSDFKILYINEAIRKMYPEIETGQQCYTAFACRSNMCPSCPLLDEDMQKTVFNPKRQTWVYSRAEKAELPLIGSCYAVNFCVLSEEEAVKGEHIKDMPAVSGDELVTLEEKNRLLQKQNRLMEFINDGMPGGYHRCLAEEGYPIVYASSKFLDMLGYTKTELKEKFGGKFVPLVHPDDIALLADGVNRLLCGGNGGELSFHYRILTKNGYMQVVDTTRVSEYEGQKFLQCVIMEISPGSEENRAGKAQISDALSDALMQEQEFRTELSIMQYEILESISCGVYAYTVPEHELLAVNTAAKRMIGCGECDDPIAAIVSFINEKIVPEDRQRVKDANVMLKVPGDTAINDYKAEVCGKIISLHSNVKLLERSGGQRYILLTLLDTTELEKRRDKLNEVLSMQRHMADSLGNGVFAYTFPEYKMLILNQEAREMFGYSVDDPDRFESYVMDSIIPEDVPGVKQAIEDLRDIGDIVEYIFRSDFPDRGRVAFKCRTKLLCFDNGQKYVISSVTDITEQKLTEMRLDEERRQYRNALAYGCESMFTIDLTDNNISEPDISPEGAKVLKKYGITLPAGYDDIAKAWFSDKRAESDSGVMDIVSSRDKLIESYENGTNIIDAEYSLVNGREYFHVMVLLYEIDSHIKASFVVYNITSDRHEEQKRMSVIDSLGQIYASLFHYSLADDKFTVYKVSGDLSADMPENITYREFCRVYLDEYVEPEFRELISGRLDPENIPSLLDGRDYITTEYKRKNTGWYRASLVAAERDGSGKVTAAVFAGYDIDEQKKAESAQQEALKAAYEAANLANAAKTNFLAAMSHDIRTPMNAIIGMTAIAETHIADRERVADCLSKINVSSKHLLGLINEVLDMSKIESGKMELQEEEFNLPDLIDNLLTMSRPQIAAKDHDLAVSVRNIDHENVIGDSQRIQQVFMNLMSNAVKYTPDGGKIRLYISEKSTNKQNIGCYEFVFQDSGIGMSEEFLCHIFEPFSRATEDARVDKIQGTGLGMPITKNIVQMMNGDITVKSRLNAGSEFTVTIFLKLRNEEDAGSFEKFSGLSVLVADEDRDSGEYTCGLLREIGINAAYTDSGREAVEKACRENESGEELFAVMLDWKMSDISGAEAVREIRRRTGSEKPAVIISSYDCPEIELEARAAGANYFISKPLFRSRIAHLFSELTGGKEEKTAYEANVIPRKDYSGKRVLLVEDVEINAEIAGEIMRMSGLEVEFAKNGKEAVDIMTDAEDNYYDIVFMDIQMPVMNGYDAARAIRSLPRDYTRSVPIIAMTANAFAEDVAAAKNVGMNEHVAKPIDIKQLHKVLQKWLSK